MKNSQQRLGNKANVTLRKNINLVRRLLSHFHILYVTIWRLCQFNDLSVDIWQREGGGVNKKKSGSPDFRSPEVGISVRETWHTC